MALFDDIKGKVFDLAQAGAAKTKELTEVAKLNLANASEEDAIKKAYIEIGKTYYANHGAAPDEAFRAQCEKIDAANARIEENKAKLAEMKEQGGGLTEETIEEEPVPPEE